MWLSNFAATRPSQITFHANDGTETTAQQGMFGTGMLQANTFTRDGYRFVGWAETANGAVKYADKAGITITGNIDLYAVWTKVSTVTFAVTPDDAMFKLYSDEARTNLVTPASGTEYTLDVGATYYYTAEKFGYENTEGAVDVTDKNETVTVPLAAKPVVTVTFTYDKEPQSPQLTAAVGERVMTPETDGTYRLPVGYSYSWSFRSANYAKKSGTIDLTAVTEGGAKTIAVALLGKTAWEGGDDVSKPTAVDGTYQITSGSELAWLAQEVNAGRGTSYNAVLTRDIDLGGEAWTPIGQYARYAYTGNFDGQGYTISRLKVTGSSSNHYGLFGVIGNGGVIRSLTVSGVVTITGSGNGTYGIDGIIGKLDAGKIEQCINEVVVSGNYNTGGTVGYLTNGGTVGQCINKASITGSYNVGGIVGQVNGAGEISDCYNRGTVTASGSKAGGIAGYLYASSSYYANEILNCYTTEAVSGVSLAAVVGNVYSTYNSKVKNCYYLSGLTADTNASAKTADALKVLAPTLGDAFVTAPAGVNDGYPILRWQVPIYAVTFAVTDAEGKTVTDAVVTIEGQTGTHTEGRWVFALPDGAGTQAAPYQIESGEQLAWLADIVSAGSGDAGGIVGRAAGTTNIIENCGNEANVSGGCNVGGILGNSQSSSTTVTVAGCYNSGSITAGDRAGGIIGRYNNSNPRITGCYNTLTDCYYLTGSIPAGALDNGANAMTLTEMQTTLLAALGEENWKQVRGVNQGLPILGWQKATSPAVFAQLAKYTRFSRESYINDDGEESSLPTSLLMWVPEENAQSYTVTLWQAVKTWIPMNEEEKAAYDAAQTAEGKADAIATEQALCALTAYARLLDGRTSLYDMTDALDGQTADVPDDTAADDRQPAKTTPVVVWIALGAVAVSGGAALVATRRRRQKLWLNADY